MSQCSKHAGDCTPDAACWTDWAEANNRLRELKLQIRDLKGALENICEMESCMCQDVRNCMIARARELVVEKPKCEHEWAHIEDHHVYCPKCKKTADLCWTCEAEKQDINGRLVCPKCAEKR